MREYLKIVDAKAGMIVELDNGFSCRRLGQVTLHCDGEMPWFPCTHGKHFLHGQTDGVHYLGVFPVEGE